VTKDGAALDLYSLGFGLDLTADLALFGFMSPFLEAGISTVPLNGVAGSALGYGQGGGGLSFFAYPLPRLMARAGASGGLAWVSVPKSDTRDAISGLTPTGRSRPSSVGASAPAS
jgi:hypothetical protein